MFVQTVDRTVMSRAMLVKQIIWEVKTFEKKRMLVNVYIYSNKYRFVYDWNFVFLRIFHLISKIYSVFLFMIISFFNKISFFKYIISVIVQGKINLATFYLPRKLTFEQLALFTWSTGYLIAMLCYHSEILKSCLTTFHHVSSII